MLVKVIEDLGGGRVRKSCWVCVYFSGKVRVVEDGRMKIVLK